MKMMMNHKASFLPRGILSLLMMLAMVLASSCSEEKKDESATDYGGAFRGGQGNGQVNNDMAQVTDNLRHVAENMVPGALVINEGFNLLDGGDPCDGLTFADCQAPLLRMYLTMSQMMLEQSQLFVSQVSQGLSALPVGASGSVLNPGDDDDIGKISFEVNARDNFRVIFFPDADGEPFVYLAVAGNEYHLQFDGAQNPENDGADAVMLETRVTYESETSFSTTFVAHGMPCKPDDVGAPEAIAVDMIRSADTWQGKAHIYLPRWTGVAGLTCDDAPTDDSKVFLYTDFVGDDDAATAALYMMKEVVDDVEDFANWQMSNYCDHFPGCFGGYAWGMSQSIADTFPNPYCVTTGAASPDWGGACTSENEAVAEPEFSPASRWILPSELAAYEVELPQDLE